MQRPFPWLLIALAGVLLLLPSPSGRFLLDLLGGLTLTILLLPLLAAGVGLIAWQVLLRRRLQRCPACGTASLGVSVCPACGADMADPTASGFGNAFIGRSASTSASIDDVTNVTINVEAVDVEVNQGE